MSKRYVDVGARCPGYCSESPSTIYCEGIKNSDTGSNWIHLAFGDQKEKKKYKYRHCRNDWQSCPIAKINTGR